MRGARSSTRLSPLRRSRRAERTGIEVDACERVISRRSYLPLSASPYARASKACETPAPPGSYRDERLSHRLQLERD